MQASALKLEHYNLLSLKLEPVYDSEPPPLGTYADITLSTLNAEVRLQDMDLDNGEKRLAVELTISARPKAEQAGFPYSFEISLLGVFDGRLFDADKREQLVAVNGASMLYGSAREILLSLTSRSVGGPVMLPTVTFAKVGEDMEKAKADSAQVTVSPSKPD